LIHSTSDAFRRLRRTPAIRRSPAPSNVEKDAREAPMVLPESAKHFPPPHGGEILRNFALVAPSRPQRRPLHLRTYVPLWLLRKQSS
jgi:hypothetical protein